MEIPYIPKIIVQKSNTTDQTRPKGIKRRATEAYATAPNAKEKKDGFEISDESKLLQRLRAEYRKLDELDDGNLFEIKIRAEKLALTMTSEQIVDNILEGTMFAVL